MIPPIRKFLLLVLTVVGSLAAPSSPGASTLSASYSSIPTGTTVDLSAAGSLDWVHWGLYTATSVDRKAGVVPLISNFKVLYNTFDSNVYAFAYQFSDNANGYSWSDGTPEAVVTNTTTGVWAYATPPPQFGTGFEVSAPADNSTRVLRVYVGAFDATGKLDAFLSDGSVPAYSQTLSNTRGNGPSWVFTFTYSASPGVDLVIRWTVLLNTRPDGNVTLQSAALSGNGVNNPPFVSITSPAENSAITASTDLNITAAASDLDGAITKVEFYDGDTRLGEATSEPYTFLWHNVPPGYHVLSAVATDTNADFASSTPVEVFVNGSGGTLSGSYSSPTNRVNLSVEGTADWAHWGLSTNSIWDHKKGVVQKISDFTLMGTNAVQTYSDNFTGYSWWDGTPTLVASNSPTGVFVTGITNGFQIVLPADTAPRRLKIYAGLYGARGNFQAYLSEFSAKAFTDTSLTNLYESSYRVYTLDYSAASAGQSLIVQYRSLVLYDLEFGNVTLQAATLQENSSASQLQLQYQVTSVNGEKALEIFPTLAQPYSLEASSNLLNWVSVFTNQTSAGLSNFIVAPITDSPYRFFRGKPWP